MYHTQTSRNAYHNFSELLTVMKQLSEYSNKQSTVVNL